MSTDPSADARQRIRIASETVSFFKPTLCNQTNITPCVRMRRAGHHAWKVRVQPIRIDFFLAEPMQHCDHFSSGGEIDQPLPRMNPILKA
jgi:hypothetical protein